MSYLKSEQTIKECALVKNDYCFLGMIDGMDLRAKEVKYHESCHRGYVKRPVEGTEQHNFENSSTSVKAAYNEAFQHICCYIETKIIQAGHVKRMTMLHNRYLQFMSEQYPDNYNPGSTVQKMKAKLIAHFV